MAYLEPITSLQDPVEESTGDYRGSRIRALRLFLVLIAVILVGRLWYLQLVSGDYYREHADRNRFRFTRVEAPRGVIYDRNGTILVRNRPSYAATITPADLPIQPEPVYRRLGQTHRHDLGGDQGADCGGAEAEQPLLEDRDQGEHRRGHRADP